ncbi:Cell wall-binding protein [Pseudonocardia sp. Ae168_Ps1]|uniref:LysM peptidoglycan-binding domain-containing protein n=1 Tax=unclassified Pseudonocardia TaxID=2619320 RepID=UPI0009634391|nr:MULTISPECIES: transglycosylase family protein [unclassified Pseudonocardia]OLL74563.1 Cell wall-binding protein [Pseudonocardia sp. Ae150A_Ps1]OLL80543.1 Cell wall-binding protein [Pseudonocardia sp. Ae168_Ps1]OLL85327.1 Cell wall-binding protein [Pseudonocardia sp. Ae263_Ps1]OLL94645.1 Cell wall-binding protein [Pseudonocardia sp. Ae356_Ps1]
MLAIVPANAATDSTWDELAHCESTGNWAANTGNGFSGGLQFTPSTWKAFGGGEYASAAHQATRTEQIAVAEKVLAEQGWNAWPSCSKKTGASGSSTPRTVERDSGSQAPTRTKLSAPAAAPSGNTYTVKSGDTLGKIAAAHGVGDWKNLRAKNPGLGAGQMIHPGQVVNV